MSGQYASQTSVSVEKSRAEIESTLARYGAERFAYITEPCMARVGFCIEDPTTGAHLSIRMNLPLPSKDDKRFTHRKVRGLFVSNDPEKHRKEWEQACRSSWRALLLVIKAKLEACAAGISTVEREFMADVVTGDGRTIGEILRPQMAEIGTSTRPLMLTA